MTLALECISEYEFVIALKNISHVDPTPPKG